MKKFSNKYFLKKTWGFWQWKFNVFSPENSLFDLFFSVTVQFLLTFPVLFYGEVQLYLRIKFQYEASINCINLLFF